MMKNGLILIVMMITAGTAGVYGQNPRTFIRDIRGTVELKAPGSSVWTAAAEGQELARETLVSTGFRSTARIGIGNSTILVRPLTRLSLGEIRTAADAEEVNVHLRAGRIHADVKPPPAGKVNFTVRSPTATASVRGTAFEFDTVNLRVDEGQVSFSGADNTVVYVAAGQSSSPDPVSGRTSVPVDTAAAPVPPPPAGSGEVSAAGGGDIMIPAAVVPIPEPEPPTDAEVGVGIRWPDSY
jgi:hypothetical protein